MPKTWRCGLAVAVAIAFLAVARGPAAAIDPVPPDESPFRMPDPSHKIGAPSDAFRFRTGDRSIQIASWIRPGSGYDFVAIHASAQGDRGILKKFAHSDDALDTFVFGSDPDNRPAFEILAGASSTLGTLKLLAFDDDRGRQCVGYLVFYKPRQNIYQKGLGGRMCPAGSNGAIERETFLATIRSLSMKGEFEALMK